MLLIELMKSSEMRVVAGSELMLKLKKTKEYLNEVKIELNIILRCNIAVSSEL